MHIAIHAAGQFKFPFESSLLVPSRMWDPRVQLLLPSRLHFRPCVRPSVRPWRLRLRRPFGQQQIFYILCIPAVSAVDCASVICFGWAGGGREGGRKADSGRREDGQGRMCSAVWNCLTNQNGKERSRIFPAIFHLADCDRGMRDRAEISKELRATFPFSAGVDAASPQEECREFPFSVLSFIRRRRRRCLVSE